MSWNTNYYATRQQLFAEHLSEMIRCRTITATDDKIPVPFFDLHRVLENNFPLVHKKLDKKLIHNAALLYRWPGKDQAAAPVMLLAHQDVVEAGGNWEQPPFSGNIIKDRIWGRGARDNKGNLCAMLEAVELLLAENYIPPVDVYIASSDNEEQMGDGAPHILKYMLEHDIKPALVLDEGTAVMEKMAGGIERPTALISLCEKGFLTVRFTARSRGGHASTPPKQTAIGQLSAFVCSMEKRPPFRPAFNNVIRKMLRTIAPKMKLPFRFVCRNLWLFSPLMPFLLSRLSLETRAQVTTTCAFTMCKGSESPNVLPAEASVTANLRLAISDSISDVMILLQKRAQKYGLECEILYGHEPSNISNQGGKEWNTLLQAVKRSFPDVLIAPTIMPAATDSRHFHAICDNVYLFSPFMMSKTSRQGIHGINENILLPDLARAVYFYEALLRNLDLS